MRLGKVWDVVVVGNLFIDEIFSNFDSLPRLGEESFAKAFQRDIGGGAAITACGLARLGLKVALLGIVGKSDGGWMIRRLEKAGVDTAAICHHSSEPTGVTVSVSTREDRAFYTYHGANEDLGEILNEKASRTLMAQGRIVHFACSPSALENPGLLEHLKTRKCRVSLDVGWHPSWLSNPRNLDFMAAVDLFLPNRIEAELITGVTQAHEVLQIFRSLNFRGVGLKLGGKGAALLWRKKEWMCDPHRVANVDTTGAGDCFDAGMIYAWLRGYGPQRSLETANICGALSTRNLGGISSFPFPEELTAAIKEKML